MRVIKFRAWDNKEKKMLYDSDLETYGTPLISLEGILCSSWTSEGGGGVEKLVDEQDRYILQQFTGLLDKNGKEIYEGDVIEIDYRSIAVDCTIYKGEVFFNTDRSLSNLEWGLWTKKGYHRTDFLGELKIIGNIYENPELLEVVK